MDPERKQSRAWAPSSLSNLGPGFDALGLAIDGWGDVVTVSVVPEPGITIDYAPNSVWTGTTDPDRNTAGRAARGVLTALNVNVGLHLSIEKRMRAGSGLGSSASSAVAAAMAVNHLFGSPLSKQRLIGPSLQGEMAASDFPHGDNVLPTLLGGLVINRSDDPEQYASVELSNDLYLAIVVPDTEILTSEARQLLPEKVSILDAAANASRLGLLIEAASRGDWKRVGQMIMTDTIVEPVRAALLPYYSDVRTEAASAGAYGSALSGSGPAMFAMCGSPAVGDRVLSAMSDVISDFGANVQAVRTSPNTQGARILSETQESKQFK